MPKEILIQYTDLPGFLTLISGDRLNLLFRRLDCFSDPTEGFDKETLDELLKAVKEFNKYEFDAGIPVGRSEAKRFYRAVMPDMASDDLNRRIAGITKEKSEKYARCWFHACEGESTIENIPMWDLYSGRYGVAVIVEKQSITSCIEKRYNAIKCDFVDYDNSNKEIGFIKSRYFSHENEYRFLFHQESSEETKVFPIELSEISPVEVRFHYQAPKWHIDRIRNIYSAYSEELVKFNLSEIIHLYDVNEWTNIDK